MTPNSRIALDKMYAEISKAIGGRNPREVFNIDPKTAQTIEDKVMQSNDFLSKINSMPVDDLAGEILAFGVPRTITRRTNTTQGDGGLRRPTDPTSLVAREYRCREIEQDTLIPWKKVDQWAHLPNFYNRWRGQVRFAQARDLLMIMWNGQKYSEDSDPVEYPELQDMQRGFFQFMIDENPDNVVGITADAAAPGGYTVDEIRIGPGAGDNGFESIDQAMFYLKDTVIHRLYRKRKTLRALVGDEILVKEKARLFGIPDSTPTEKVAREVLLKTMQVGEVERDSSDEFPMRGIFLTELDNLSHYWQRDSIRSQYDEQSHARKGVVNWYYKNCDNVLEVAEAAGCFHPDSIHLPTGYDASGKATGWAAATTGWKVDGMTRTPPEAP